MEPLLQRIKEDRTAVLTPIIDVIDDKTLQYYNSNGDFFQVITVHRPLCAGPFGVVCHLPVIEVKAGKVSHFLPRMSLAA